MKKEKSNVNYLPDDKKATEVMHPSSTFNKIIDEM